MKTKTVLLFAILLMLGITSCDKSMFIRGNKSVTSVQRDLSEFDKIANNGSFEVTIINDDAYFVLIEAESNLISHIETRISNNALIIDSDENLVNRRPMKIEVHTNQLRAIELNGSGFIHTESFESGVFSAVIDGSGDISTHITNCEDAYVRVNGSGGLDIDVEAELLQAGIYGSGDLNITGKGKESKMEIHGSGSIYSKNFLHDSSESIIDGSGSIYVYVTAYLNAKIWGSGSVYYSGMPAIIDTEINGSGSVISQ
jgi:hypothetical protein